MLLNIPFAARITYEYLSGQSYYFLFYIHPNIATQLRVVYGDVERAEEWVVITEVEANNLAFFYHNTTAEKMLPDISVTGIL